MDILRVLSEADEVRTFPLLQMPLGIATNIKSSDVFKKNGSKKTELLPQLFTSHHLPIRNKFSGDTKLATWEAPSTSFANLILDGTTPPSSSAADSQFQEYLQTGRPKTVAIVNLGDSRSSSGGTKEIWLQSPDMMEYKSQFKIYKGATLSSTPEFESYRSAYNHNWSAITGVIRELEDYLRGEEVRLAIIDGVRVHEIAFLNSVTGVYKEDLISCISNIVQIRADNLDKTQDVHVLSQTSFSSARYLRAAIVVQAMLRGYLGLKRHRKEKVRCKCAIVIQCNARRMICTRFIKGEVMKTRLLMENRWEMNVEKLKKIWMKPIDQLPSPSTISSSSITSSNSPSLMPLLAAGSLTTMNSLKNQLKLLIFIPSISASEYIRLSFDGIRALQNMHLVSLYQLVDPLAHVVYVSPVHLTSEEVAYHERFLSVLGIKTSSAGVKRLHFVVPELIDKLPSHISLAQVLWCSTSAIKKIKNLIKRMPNAIIVPTSLSWVERRLSNLFNVPMLSPDPLVAMTLSCRSFSKKVFSEACVNAPIGAHDISSSGDFYVALSSLIASNIEVKRWIFRLNVDFNREGYAYLETDKLSVMAGLRGEIATLLEADNNAKTWFSKKMQLEVRKKVMQCLRSELPSKITVCRRDIYGSWEGYEKYFRQYGLVMEAEPLEVTGYVQGLCFVDPNGEVQLTDGVDLLVDEKYQVQGYIGPQSKVSRSALRGATAAIAELLHYKFAVVGYITVDYQTHWDALEGRPRLCALGVQFGLSPAFLGCGAAAVVGSTGGIVSSSFLPLGDNSAKIFVFIPYLYFKPLCLSRDDVFLKFCKMKGIGFDSLSRNGTLFFHIDTILGGALNILCVANTRIKALDLVVQTLNFVVDQFGNKIMKNKSEEYDVTTWENLSSILSNLQNVSKEKNKKKVQENPK